MRKFQEEYREEVNRLPKIRIDAQTVGDEVRHRRMEKRRKRRTVVRTAAAAAVFLLCGAGTAAAVSYSRSVFEITDSGYRAVGEKVRVLEDNGGEGYDAGESGLEGYRTEGDDSGNVFESGPEEPAECQVIEYTPVEYTSIEEFKAQEAIPIAIPDLQLLGENPVSERVAVLEEAGQVTVFVEFGESKFYMSQWDHRGTESYASSTVFSGESANERHFVSDQGLDYTVFDTIEGNELISTHAVISVNGRDLSFDFIGYENEKIENVLAQLDLSIYFEDK